MAYEESWHHLIVVLRSVIHVALLTPRLGYYNARVS